MHLPSTKDLRAFELVSRRGSIKVAAEELHLSPSALSRRIQGLEEELGQPLFIRDARGLTLTDAGREYAEQLRQVFQSLEQATSALRQRQRQHLKIIAPPALMPIIMPHLGSCEENLPHLDIELDAQSISKPGDLNKTDADLVISWGEGDWEGWESQLISPRGHLALLCAPQYLQGRLLETEELSQHTWLVAKTMADCWDRWHAALGVTPPKPARKITTTNGLMAIDAAIHGQGLVIGYGFGGMPSMDVFFGRLVHAHAFHASTPGFGYHLRTHGRNENPAIAPFKEWFFREVWSKAGVRKIAETMRRQHPTPG